MTGAILIHYCNYLTYQSIIRQAFSIQTSSFHGVVLVCSKQTIQDDACSSLRGDQICNPMNRTLANHVLYTGWAAICAVTIVNRLASTIENDVNYILRNQEFIIMMNDRELYRDQRLSPQLHQFYQEHRRISIWEIAWKGTRNPCMPHLPLYILFSRHRKE